jgi:hypothetical protein
VLLLFHHLLQQTGGPTTITITPRANGCTGTAVTYSITVHPTPTATAPANQLIAIMYLQQLFH